MYFSHVRIDGPISIFSEIEKVLTKYAVAYVCGHELSKKSKKPHFHIHVEHSKHRDNVRRAFRRVLPMLSRTQLTVSAMRETVKKNIMYCIKNHLHKCFKVSLELINEAKEGIVKFNRQKGMRLTEKCVEHIGEKLISIFGQKESGIENMIMNIKLKRPVISIALCWFKEQGLSYPLKSWMDKMYIQLLMDFDLLETAIDFYE